MIQRRHRRPYLLTAPPGPQAIAADVHVFVGEVSTEVQVVDSTTGVILAEAMDRRVGTHSLWNAASTWGDVKDAMGIWTDRMADGLSKLQERR